MDLGAFFKREFAEHEAVVRATLAQCEAPFRVLAEAAAAAIGAGGKLLFFGNGGSAADAQHLATELTVRYVKDRPPIAALALTTDTSALTAIGNDLGFEHLFARQVRALGRPGDLAIGISTSGKSRNVILGLEAARATGRSAAATAASSAASPIPSSSCPRASQHGSRKCTFFWAKCSVARSSRCWAWSDQEHARWHQTTCSQKRWRSVSS
jgi:D-sedoheptulose 7-phosphate isomerase